MKIKILLVAIITGIFLTSCEKILDIDSKRLVSEENMWKTVEDARAALMGSYGLARAAFADNHRHWLYGDVRKINGKGGDFSSTLQLDIKAVSDNNLKANYPLLNELSDWRRFYAAINAANIFIERAPGIVDKDRRYLPSDLKLDVAHARFIRAFMYFYMVRIWGDVPFIVSSHDGEFKNMPREDKSKILAFVEAELLSIGPDLPVAYDRGQPEQTRTPYYTNEEEVAKKHSAYALLAHVYAWQGKYADAAIWAKWVIDNREHPGMGNQRLFFMSLNDTRRMFRGEFGAHQFNIIVGFSRMFYNGEAATSGFLESLTLAAPYIQNKTLPAIHVPKDTIVSVFNESGDVRFNINPITTQPNTDEYFGAFDRPIPIFTKVFIVRDNFAPINSLTSPSSEGITTFGSSTVFTRLEDLELLLAEARLVLGDRADAITLLNNGRQRRGLAVYNESLHGPLLEAIFTERRKELMGEGWRWYDYVRYKKIRNDDPAFNNLINNGGIYWPIARSVMSANPLLTQNPFWQ